MLKALQNRPSFDLRRYAGATAATSRKTPHIAGTAWCTSEDESSKDKHKQGRAFAAARKPSHYIVGWHETTGCVDIAGNFLPAVPAGHLWVEAGSSVILSPEISSSMNMSDMF